MTYHSRYEFVLDERVQYDTLIFHFLVQPHIHIEILNRKKKQKLVCDSSTINLVPCRIAESLFLKFWRWTNFCDSREWAKFCIIHICNLKRFAFVNSRLNIKELSMYYWIATEFPELLWKTIFANKDKNRKDFAVILVINDKKWNKFTIFFFNFFLIEARAKITVQPPNKFFFHHMYN